MRFLGVDYGTKRIGLALSDEKGMLAFPKETLANNSDILKKLGEIIKTENISEIVVGESTDFSGKPNILSEKIEILISKAKKEFKLPVHRQKEFLTSVEARRYGNGKRVDASAAALILQRYLDRRSRQKEG